jgi:hypothetical protein
MPRNVTSDYILALNSGSMYPCIFVEIYFASGPVRLCTAMYDTLLNGNTFKGVGRFLEISTIEDGATVLARGISVALSGIDPTLIAAALDQFQVGLPATITLGLLGSEAFPGLVNLPVVAWQGRTDEPTIMVDEKTASISVNLESALLDMNTPVPYRWTAETQAIFFPKDKGFRFVTSIQNVPTYWNQVESNNGTP